MKLFDAHLHIIDPRYPLVENRGYLPPNFTVKQYLDRVKNLNMAGGVVVSGSFQGYDYDYLLDALEQLGENFRGVVNLPAGIPKRVLGELDKAGVKAVRFNIVRGGADQLKSMLRLSNQVYDTFGWHSELYIKNENIRNLKDTLISLPAYSIDHLGLTKEGLNELYGLVEGGAKVKASGFGRVNFDVIEVMRKIYSINPKALIFGTDLPSTRSKRPFSEDDIEQIRQNFSKEEQERIFYKNGYQWYMSR